MTLFARQSDSFCSHHVSPETLPRDSDTPGGGQRVTIAGSVGNRGVNRAEDVRKIQGALNRVPAAVGGASPSLDVDGKCGSKTIQAIQKYQLKHFGFRGADGRADPGKRTIAKLNEDTGAISFPDLSSVVRLTKAWVMNCLRNLQGVDDVLDRVEPEPGAPFRLQVGTRAEKMRLVNKHFDLDRFPNKRSMYGIIRTTFETMRQVLERPGGLWGAQVFERDPLNRRVQAYAFGGGFFHEGRVATIQGKQLRADAIYLCVRFANELRSDKKRAFVVIHELAHFAARRPIGDFAHNKQGAKIRTISPHLKVLNAETYANFAWDVSNREPVEIF